VFGNIAEPFDSFGSLDELYRSARPDRNSRISRSSRRAG